MWWAPGGGLCPRPVPPLLAVCFLPSLRAALPPQRRRVVARASGAPDPFRRPPLGRPSTGAPLLSLSAPLLPLPLLQPSTLCLPRSAWCRWPPSPPSSRKPRRAERGWKEGGRQSELRSCRRWPSAAAARGHLRLSLPSLLLNNPTSCLPLHKTTAPPEPSAACRARPWRRLRRCGPSTTPPSGTGSRAGCAAGSRASCSRRRALAVGRGLLRLPCAAAQRRLVLSICPSQCDLNAICSSHN